MTQGIEERVLPLETASWENTADFGEIVGPHEGLTARPLHYYRGEIRKPRFVSDAETEISVATLQRRPLEVRWLERHFKHTQVFLPLGGRPFVLVLAPPGEAALPDPERVRAFLFDGGAGFAMHLGTWHEFPFPLVDDTSLVVILRHETVSDLQNVVADEVHGEEAVGGDLEKRNIQSRLGLRFVVRA